MAGEKLTWVFELLDKMSGPAEKIAASMKKLDPAIKSNASQTSLFARGIGFIGNTFGPKAASAVLRFAGAASALFEKSKVLAPIMGSIGRVGATAGKGLAVAGTAMLAIGAAAATASAGAAFVGGRFVANALMFKEDTLVAFESILGSKSEANRVMAMATKFAATTPFKTSEVVDMAKSLLTRGFKANELEKLMLGVGDVGSLLGAEKMDSVINALGKMRASGKLTGETMQMLADAGINLQAVYGALQKATGKSSAEIEKMMSAGQLTDKQGVDAVMSAIETTLSGGKLGGGMEKGSKTIKGLLSTLESIPEELVMKANMDGLTEPLKTFIKTFSDALGTESEAGQRLVAMLEKIGKSIGDMFYAMSQGDIKGSIGGILDVLTPIVSLFTSFGEGVFAGFRAVVGPVMEWFSEVGKSMTAAGGSLSWFVDGFKTFGKVLGGLIAGVGGFLALIVGLEMALVGTLGQAISWVVDAFREAWAAIMDSQAVGMLRKSLADLGAKLRELGAKLQPVWAAFGKLWDIVAKTWSKITGLDTGSFSFLETSLGAIVFLISGMVDAMTFFASGLIWVVEGVTSILKAFNDLWTNIDSGAKGHPWAELGMDIVRSIINGVFSMFSPAGGAMGTLADVMSGSFEAKLGSMFGAKTPGPVVAPPSQPNIAPAATASMGNMFPAAFGAGQPGGAPAANSAPTFGASSGPVPGAQPAQPTEQTFSLSGLSAVFNINGGEGGAAAGKEAADSFMGQLAAGLKGIASEMGR